MPGVTQTMRKFMPPFLLLLLVCACGSTPTAASATPTPRFRIVTPSNPPTTTPSPVESPPQPGFTCGDAAGASAATQVKIVAVRTGGYPGYDRFVVEFAGAVPTYEVQRRPTSKLVQDASGQTVTLDGNAGVQVTFHNVATPNGYGGAQDLKTDLPELREARQLGDFEGVTQWGLGVAHSPCMHVFTLDSPPRLVIDLA
jgi:hypothetical protein